MWQETIGEIFGLIFGSVIFIFLLFYFDFFCDIRDKFAAIIIGIINGGIAYWVIKSFLWPVGIIIGAIFGLLIISYFLSDLLLDDVWERVIGLIIGGLIGGTISFVCINVIQWNIVNIVIIIGAIFGAVIGVYLTRYINYFNDSRDIFIGLIGLIVGGFFTFLFISLIIWMRENLWFEIALSPIIFLCFVLYFYLRTHSAHVLFHPKKIIDILKQAVIRIKKQSELNRLKKKEKYNDIIRFGCPIEEPLVLPSDVDKNINFPSINVDKNISFSPLNVYKNIITPLDNPYWSHRCNNCGRILTDPKSIERGYGPICWRRR